MIAFTASASDMYIKFHVRIRIDIYVMGTTLENQLGKSEKDYTKIVVCIPALNQGNKVRMIVKTARNFADVVIVCDDGSSDNTFSEAEQAGAFVIRHPRNLGYGKAIRSLFQRALEFEADIIVSMDSDGQHNPEQIPKIVQPIIKEGMDIVIGSRFLDDTDKSKVPFHRSLGIKIISKLIKYTSYENITDAQSGFRAYSRHALQELNLVQDGMSISTELLLKAKAKKLKITEVAVTISYNVDNTSTHNFLSHGIALLFNLIHFISLRHPMMFYGLPGMALLIISGFFSYNTLMLFSSTRFISINMILISTSAAIVGIVLLTMASILFAIVGMVTERTGSNVLSRLLHFISLRHPMMCYGFPGIVLIIVSGVYGYNALELFSSSRYVTITLTNMLFVMVGTAVIGIVLLGTGSILFSVAAMLKGRLISEG